jgi:hypothetical protein
MPIRAQISPRANQSRCGVSAAPTEACLSNIFAFRGLWRKRVTSGRRDDSLTCHLQLHSRPWGDVLPRRRCMGYKNEADLKKALGTDTWRNLSKDPTVTPCAGNRWALSPKAMCRRGR